ncbi:MAG: methylmalonyl-CoA epimerase [Deltaproteobacteria bacterium]|nr:methylmalonyl-CoA epimerase [Deltaproteobacteria bacterium]
MRFSYIDHIGIAVDDLECAIERYTRLHGAPPSYVTTVPAEQVTVAFFPVGPTKIELLAGTSAESPIARFIAKRGPGLHHICYAVEDWTRTIATLHDEGMTPIVREASVGAGGKRVLFFHPREMGGVLIELLAVTPPTPILKMT